MNSLPAIEIYSIGTELLNGQIQDSNAFWMAQQIAALGGYVRRICILDDQMEELTSVFQDACQRGAKLIITTGGLGPTPDDMTVQAIAQIKGEEIVVDEALVAHFMASRDIEKREDVSEGLLKMATRPAHSKAHLNPAGVAPCVETQIGETVIYNLPGPPREVEALFGAVLKAPIAELYSGTRAALRVVVNLPESQCGPILHSVMEEYPNTYLKAFVALSERTADGQRLPVDIVAWAEEDAQAQALLDEALRAFTERAAEKGSSVEPMEE